MVCRMSQKEISTLDTRTSSKNRRTPKEHSKLKGFAGGQGQSEDRAMNKETHSEIIQAKIVVKDGEITAKLEGYVVMKTSVWEEFCDEMERLKEYYRTH